MANSDLRMADKPFMRFLSSVLAFLIIFGSFPVTVLGQNELGNMPAYAAAPPTDSPPPPTDTAPPPTHTAPPPSGGSTPTPAPTPKPVYAPRVATQAASGITPESAVLNGSILDDGGGEITDAGFYWWSSSGTGGKVNCGSGLSYTLPGLKEGTTYYFYAFAANAAGKSSGSVLSFKTPIAPLVVATLEATDIGCDSATLHGKVTGGGYLVAYGFTITSPSVKSYYGIRNADGSISVEIDGLKPGVTYTFRANATNAEGMLYGSTVSFTTLKAVPKVSTSGMSSESFNMTTADLYGFVIDKGSSDIREAGFLWGTDAKPGNKVVAAYVQGSLQSLLRNLKPNTIYYYQAYATNQDGTGYGEVVSFTTLPGNPTIAVSAQNEATPVSATLTAWITNGDILMNQGLPVTESGFMWGTGSKPDKKVVVAPGSDHKSLSYALKGLKPDTTYFFLAFAKNSVGVVYSQITAFKTLKGVPEVETWDPKYINAIGATLEGFVSNAGILKDQGLAVTDSGIIWGTGPKPDKKVSIKLGGAYGSVVSYLLNELQSETTCYFQAYAANSAGTVYGEVKSFTTTNGDPVVITQEADTVTPMGARLNGYVQKDYYLPVTDSGFLWGTDPKPDKKVSAGPGNYFSLDLKELKDDTTYYFQAYATSQAGTGYGEVLSFKTPVGDPEVETIDAVDINPLGATISASIIDRYGLGISDSGFLFGTTPEPDQKITILPGVQGFQFNISQILKTLKPETTYYFQAYATNAAGTAYGEVLSFGTINGDPIVVTQEADQIEPTGARLTGLIKDDIGLDIVESGFYWGIGPEPDIKVVVPPGEDEKALEYILEDLTVDTKYYFKAYAINAAGIGYGEVLEFTTITNAPIVETRPCGIISSVAAEINGFIIQDYGFEVIDSGFLWGTDPEPDTKVSALPGSDGKSFSFTLPRLRGNTVYYIQAYALTSEGIGFGEVISFKTKPPIAPTVTTRSADFDSESWKPSAKGSIDSNGGDAILNYGFRYSADQKNWINFMAGENDYYGEFNAIIAGDRVPPGDCYIQAYATNSAGTGYGASVKITTPALPSVTCSVSSSATGSAAAVLTGNVTDTGGKGVVCGLRQFQYRKAESKDWQDIGVEQGSFGAGPYTFSFEDLEPGINYEFRALAQNPAGLSISATAAYTASWGQNDIEAAKNMKAAGMNAVGIAEVLKKIYADSGEACYNALMKAGFDVYDVCSALKKSSYGEAYGNVVKWLKSSGCDVITVAKILQNTYEKEIRMGYYNGAFGFKPAIISTLRYLDYDIDEILAAIRALYNYSIQDSINQLAFRVFSKDDTYGAIMRGFGADKFAEYIWGPDKNLTGWDAERTLRTVAQYMQKYGKMTASETLDVLMGVYPRLDLQMAASALSSAGYGMNDTGALLAQFFGNDPFAVSLALISKTSYEPSQIEEYLIKTMNASAGDMVRVLNLVLNNKFNKYTEIPRVLATFYGMDVKTATITMYANGYSLNDLLLSIDQYYKLKSATEVIGVFKEIGLSSHQIIDKLWNRYTEKDMLPALRVLGYPAVDYISFVKSYKKLSSVSDQSQAGLLFSYLARGGYELAETARALKDIYGIDQTVALKLYTDMNFSLTLGLDNNDIIAAIDQAYGVNTVLDEVKHLISSGSTLVQVLCTMRNSMGITEPGKAAGYLVQAGCGEADVLYAVELAFYSRFWSKEIINSIYSIDQRLFGQSSLRPTVDALLRAVEDAPDAVNIIRLLNDNNYSINDIARLLKDDYSQTPYQVIIAFMKILGSKNIRDIADGVDAVFGSDMIPGYLQVLKETRSTAEQAYYEVKRLAAGADPLAIATYLATAGYGENDVLSILIIHEYQQRTTPDILKELAGVLEKVYDKVQGEIAGILGAYGATGPGQAVAILNQGGYSLLDIIKALKDVYDLEAGEFVGILSDSGLYEAADIEANIQEAYGEDYALIYVRYWLSLGQGAVACFDGLSRDLGITDTMRKVSYLRAAGISDSDVLTAVGMYARNEIIPVVKYMYGLNDPIALAAQFKQLKNLRGYCGLNDFTGALQRTFPGMTCTALVKAALAAGFPVESGGESIRGWLMSNAMDGQRDDELAAILGSANPGDLGLRAVDTVEILCSKGYNLQETVTWLLKDKYKWENFFAFLIYYYDPGNNDASSIVRSLKNLYSIDDLAKGVLGYLMYMGGESSPGEFEFAWVYAHLRNAGYSVDETVRAIVKLGATAVSSLIGIMYDESIDIANAASNQSLRYSAAYIADTLYNIGSTTPGVSFSLVDIARGLVDCGPAAGGFACFKKAEIYDAMQYITFKYLVSHGLSAPVDVTALHLLRLGGLSVYDAAATLADKRVGLSTGSVIKSIFGIGNDWFDAVVMLVGAGYSTSSSISAIYSNRDYHNIIGVSILSAMVTKAITWLDDTGKAADIIRAIKKVADLGFKIESAF